MKQDIIRSFELWPERKILSLAWRWNTDIISVCQEVNIYVISNRNTPGSHEYLISPFTGKQLPAIRFLNNSADWRKRNWIFPASSKPPRPSALLARLPSLPCNDTEVLKFYCVIARFNCVILLTLLPDNREYIVLICEFLNYDYNELTQHEEINIIYLVDLQRFHLVLIKIYKGILSIYSLLSIKWTFY